MQSFSKVLDETLEALSRSCSEEKNCTLHHHKAVLKVMLFLLLILQNKMTIIRFTWLVKVVRAQTIRSLISLGKKGEEGTKRKATSKKWNKSDIRQSFYLHEQCWSLWSLFQDKYYLLQLSDTADWFPRVPQYTCFTMFIDAGASCGTHTGNPT